jgi:hypothetical protein
VRQLDARTVRLLVGLAIVAACAVRAPQRAGAQQAEGGGWTVEVIGARRLVLGGADLERLLGARRMEMKLAAKGGDRVYSGYPLGWIAALVDDPGEGNGSELDEERWKLGYDITVTARDGYAATLSTAELDPDAALLADREGGKPIAPTVVGTMDKSLWVKDVASIELAIEGALVPDAVSAATEEGEVQTTDAFVEDIAPDFSVVLDLNGTEHRFTLLELNRSPLFVQAPGSFTTSAGTTYAGQYGGVRLAALIGQYVTLKPSDTVELVAMDGYRMQYAAEDFLDTSKGEWILAFRLDGAYLPRDPGYVRTMKVGLYTPNIDGHLSVKMVERVVLRQSGYRAYELVIDGAMQARLDRQTVQSCVNCHGVSVAYERKGQAASYRGVALWRFLAYGDDPERAPHKAPSSVTSYDAEAAKRGYAVGVIAADGFSISLDSRALHANDGIILATEKDGAEAPDAEWPLVLVWDRAATVPESIKPVKQVVKLALGAPTR